MSPLHIHVVRPGDCIESIAADVGCVWQDLWEHRQNRGLRALRSNPSLLAPGDLIRIPDELRPAPRTIQAGGTHHFRCEVPRTTLRVRLVRRDEEGTHAVSGIPYRLQVGATSVDGITTDDGHVEAEVPANERHGRLELSPGTPDAHVVELAIGHLDPIEHGGGVLQRLQNLGLVRGLPTEEALASALATFQREHGLTGDGVANDETVAKLREVHDG